MNRTADAVGLLTWLVTDREGTVSPTSVAEAVRVACDLDVDDAEGRREVLAATIATIARVPNYGHVDPEALVPPRTALLTLLDCSGDGTAHLLAEHDVELTRLTRNPATFHQQLAVLVERTVEVLRDLEDGLRVLTTLGSLSHVVEVCEAVVERLFATYGDDRLHDLLHADLPRGATPPGDLERAAALRDGARLLRDLVHAHNLAEGSVAFDRVSPQVAAGAVVASGAVHVAVRQAARQLEGALATEDDLEELDHVGPPGEDLFPISLMTALVLDGEDEHAALWSLAEKLAADGPAHVCERLEAGWCSYGTDLDELVLGEASGFELVLAGLDAAASTLGPDLLLSPSTFDLTGARELVEQGSPAMVDDVAAEVERRLATLDDTEIARRLRRASVDPVAARWILDHLL